MITFEHYLNKIGIFAMVGMWVIVITALLLIIGYGIYWTYNLLQDLRKHIDNPIVHIPMPDWKDELIRKHNLYQYSLEEIKTKLKEMGVTVLNEKGRMKGQRKHFSGFVAERNGHEGIMLMGGDSLWQSYALCLSACMDTDERRNNLWQ